MAVTYSPELLALLPHDPDTRLTTEQYQHLLVSREYVLPIFNRGQRATFLFLSTVVNEAPGPIVLLEIVEAGVAAIFRQGGKRIFGVAEKPATITGLVAAVAIYAGVVWIAPPVWAAALCALLAGLACRPVGAIVYRLPFEFMRLIGR
ncbi:hypothetical protein DXK93_10910 [Achromobacter sp. K91]|nr:hypothetical protein DXK93_10910 [Achromobacter sp. K91]